MNNDINEKIEHAAPVPPFVRFVASAVPMVFDNSLSYYEALCALWKWLQDDVIDVINNNASVTEVWRQELTTFEDDLTDKFNDLNDAFDQLHEYVDTYFENLDVQEEINNKLDQMVEDGTLQEIITTYIQSNVTWTFDNVSEMQSATNLIAGSFAQTLGFHTLNDGGGAIYYISDTGTANGMDVISCGSLYAILMNEEHIDLAKLGAYTDASVDCSSIMTYALSKANAQRKSVYIGNGKFLISQEIEISDNLPIIGNDSFYVDQARVTTDPNHSCLILNNGGFYLKGRALSGSYDWCVLYLKNFKVKGVNGTEKFIKYDSWGAPARPSTIDNVEAYNLETFLEVKDYRSQNRTTAIDNLIMSNCGIFECNYAIDASATAHKTSIGSALISNNVMETTAGVKAPAISIDGIHGSVKLINNMLEGGTRDFTFYLIGQGTLVMDGNYFEANYGKVMVTGTANASNISSNYFSFINNTVNNGTKTDFIVEAHNVYYRMNNPQFMVEKLQNCVLLEYNGIYLDKDSYGVIKNTTYGWWKETTVAGSPATKIHGVDGYYPAGIGNPTFTSTAANVLFYGYKLSGKIEIAFGTDSYVIPYDGGVFFAPLFSVSTSETNTVTITNSLAVLSKPCISNIGLTSDYRISDGLKSA